MKKGKTWFLSLFLSGIFVLAFISEAAAVDLVVDGFLKIDTAYRLENRVWNDKLTGLEDAKTNKGDLSRCRSTISIEPELSITPNLRFNAILRGHYEAKYHLDSDIYTLTDSKDLDTVPKGEMMEKDVDLREYYVTGNIGNFTIKAGRQQISWGEADAIRIADIINPLDMSWNYAFPMWEDIRIPQRMIDIVYVVPGSPHQFKIEVVLNPEDYRPYSWAPYGDNWFIQGEGSWIPVFAGLPLPGVYGTQSVSGSIFDALKIGLPDEHELSNFQGGVRVRGVFSGWDIHLYQYYQRVQNPVITSNPYPGGPFGPPGAFGPFNPFDSTFGIRAHYPWINTVGATFNVFNNHTQTVFRGECGYIFDEPHTIYDPALGDFFGTQYIKKDSFSYMLGFDRPTWIKFLNPNNTFFISGQFFQKFIFNLDDDNYTADTLCGKLGHDDQQTMLTLLVNTQYFDAKIKPEVLAVWDINGQNGFIKPLIAYEPTYDWRLELGANFIWGEEYGSGHFGPVRDCDEVFFVVKYKFSR